MIDMVKRHEIQVLRRAGHALAETAELAGVSQSTVQRVEAEPPVVSFDAEADRGKRRIGRPSKVEPFRPLRSEEHTSELQSPCNLVCRLLLEKKKTRIKRRAGDAQTYVSVD